MRYFGPISQFSCTGCRLYAVAGCGQLDSVEYLDLESAATEGGRQPAENANVESSHWQLACPMAHPRHLPGVRYHWQC